MVNLRRFINNIKDGAIWFTIFSLIGIWRWQATGSVFYVMNFGYIGLSIMIGDFLFKALEPEKKSLGRRITQLMIGIYMLGFLGFLGRENMQIEGFFFYLFAGVFAGSTLHYFIAKIIGPVIFGRGWCGWACWTTMILDFLPWKIPENGRLKYLGLGRYLYFTAALVAVSVLFYIKDFQIEKGNLTELYWLALGNILYFTSAIIFAALVKDNRAFCKYICPVPVLMKVTSRFALYKQKIDKGLCNECGICEDNCPMDVRLLDYSEEDKRILSTECVLCSTCEYSCPENAIKTTVGFDIGSKEYLNKRYRSNKD